MMLVLPFLLAMAEPLVCEPVTADRIFARDLAAAVAAFAAAPPDAVAGFAPAPGAQRVFSPQELNSLLRRHNLSGQAQTSVCFEWRMRRLSPDAVTSAMRETLAAQLGIRDFSLEIVEFSLFPSPEGSLHFPLSGLSDVAATTEAPVLWKGYVEYGPNRKWNVWARANVRAKYGTVVAASALKQGQIVSEADVQVTTATGIPSKAVAHLAEDVVGRELRSGLETGSAIPLRVLARAYDIRKGEPVRVQVQSPATKLILEGQAEIAGRIGDDILIRNSASKRTFRARVTGPGTVRVDVGEK